MDLPKNARVIVVDNDPDDISELLSVLAKDGVATLYYRSQSSFPAAPLKGIRLLFLDLELDGLRGQPPKMKAATAVANLRRLVSPDNGPLVVVIWTNHDELEELVKKELFKAAQMPLFVACVAKDECKPEGSFSADAIRSQIITQLSAADIFGLHVAWENAVFNGANELSNRFARLAPVGEDWAKTMSYTYGKLYETNDEGGGRKDVKGQFASACALYSEGLVREIGMDLDRTPLMVANGFEFAKGGIPSQKADAVKGRLNAFLFFTENPTKERLPGTVYAVGASARQKEIQSAIVKDFYKSDHYERLIAASNVKLCKVIITPACDYAGGKHLHPGGKGVVVRNYDRVAYGLLINHKLYTVCGRKLFSSNCPHEKLYKELSGFEYRGKKYDLIIHLGTVSLEELGNKGLMYLFTLKSGCLADIQSKAANQLNRIGICAVK